MPMGWSAIKQIARYTNFIVLYIQCLCINQMYFKNNNKCIRMSECNIIIWQTPTRFGHSCDPFQGGKNKNTINIIVCLNQSTVKVTKFRLISWLKEYLTGKYKILEDKDCSTCRIVLWMRHIEDTCGEKWSRWVSGDINSKVNHLELYIHFFTYKITKLKRMQFRQLRVVTDLLKQNTCSIVGVGRKVIKQVVITVKAYHFCQLRTKYCPTSFSQG